MSDANKRNRRRARQHTRQTAAQTTKHEPTLTDRTQALAAAVTNLTGPQPQQTDTNIEWLPSRYTTLRQALYGTRGGAGYTAPSSLIPLWIDALKLLITIDGRAHQLGHQHPPTRCHLDDRHQHQTIRRLNELTTHPWTPDHLGILQTVTAELQSYAKAIDDLFAPKPIYLPYPCPHCGHTHAHRTSDTGETVTNYALAVTAADGAICLRCHDTWPRDRLEFLGTLLGTNTLPKGITA